jgi:hypothetical protein
MTFSRLLKDDAILVNETLLFSDEDFETNGTETTKRSSRDAFNEMETDLSAELMVMPLDNTGETTSSGGFFYISNE